MIFSLEALEAKHGDALILYHGEEGGQSLVVIDGGPHQIYQRSLRRRLESLRPRGRDLNIPLMMVSHLDEDHIQGLVDLTDELVRMKENPINLPDDIQNRPPHDRPALPYRIQALWFNGFDRILENRDDELNSLAASAPSASADAPADRVVRPLSEVLPVSVKQGLRLKENVAALRDEQDATGIVVNDGSRLIVAPDEGLLAFAFDPAEDTFYRLKPGEEPEDGALKLTVLGPNGDQLVKLHKSWDADVKKFNLEEKEAEGAKYADDKIFNLSSIVVLAEAGGKSMLLTGDARGDFVIEAARQAGLLRDGSLHVNLLKMPHHGSDRNAEADFFSAFPADHYVVSADGKYDNPSLPTFEYLFAARAHDESPFTIHLTNDSGVGAKAKAHMETFVTELKRLAQKRPRVEIVYRRPEEPSVVVNLHDAVRLPRVTP